MEIGFEHFLITNRILTAMKYFLLLLLASCGTITPFLPASGELSSISLPPGFFITLYAENVTGARSLAFAQETLYVGTRGEGKVYAVQDLNGDGFAEDVQTILSNKHMPNGIVAHNGSLYVAEIETLTKYDLTTMLGEVIARFPTETHHGWKYLRLGPDGKLYVPIGAPCNVCNTSDPYGTILRMNMDGSDREFYARGIRNTVGFDWHPETHELYFTDNGRDWFGDDVPPDELNHAPVAGMNFGFPYCHGNLQDDVFVEKKCSEFSAPTAELGPHVAALGMRFYDSEMFPSEYQNKAFIAEHGSWNRKEPMGYRVTTVDIETGEYTPFAEGWLKSGTAWGRPVDILVMDDGSMLVSDDKAGKVYRITYPTS